jgi:hypothetical protein
VATPEETQQQRQARSTRTFFPGGDWRLTVAAWPMCWWLPPPCGCSTGFMATPRTFGHSLRFTLYLWYARPAFRMGLSIRPPPATMPTMARQLTRSRRTPPSRTRVKVDDEHAHRRSPRAKATRGRDSPPRANALQARARTRTRTRTVTAKRYRHGQTSVNRSETREPQSSSKRRRRRPQRPQRRRAPRVDGLLHARRQTDLRLALVVAVADDRHVVTRRARQLAAVANALLDVARDGTLGHLSHGQHVADSQLRCSSTASGEARG